MLTHYNPPVKRKVRETEQSWLNPKRSDYRTIAFPLVGLAIGLTLLILFGCAKRERAVDIAVREGVLLLNNGTEPSGLDPHRVTGVPENNIISSLIEGLITYHPSDDSLPEPGVAERWDADADLRIWTFHLRQNARWSNGEPVTAHDFVYSFKRMLSPALGAEYADMLYILENGEAYHKGVISDFDEVGVKAVDDGKLRIILVGSTPFFLSMLKHYAWYPVHAPTIERFGRMDDRISTWTRPENYVGNGPFVLQEWVTNQVVKVVKSATYWDRENVRLNAIHFFPIDNSNTDEASFLAGQSHIAYTVPSDKIPYHRRENPDLIRLDPYLGTYYYRFNVTRSPFDRLQVRRALSLAVDRQQIVDRLTKGDQRPAYGYTPDGMTGYQTPQPLEFNVDRARVLLAEAGFPGGEGFPTAEILINTSENHRRIAEAIQEMWRIHLNINVSIVNQEWKVYLNEVTNLQYDISRSGWIGDYMDPITFLGMFTTGNGNNNTGWSSPAYDAIIAEVHQLSDTEERFTLLQRAESLLLEELPILPIYWYTRIFMLDPRVKGWNPKLLDNRPYKYIYLQE